MRITGLKKYKYKYDMHVHTSPVSTCGDFSPEETVIKYANLGFDGFVLTNHFTPLSASKHSSLSGFVSYYLNDYEEAKEYGKKYKVDVMLGLEIRFPENNNDYLVYRVDEDDVFCAAQYLYTDYKTFYREFKNDRNIIIQAHPLRGSVTLCDLDYVDGIEVFNMHPGHNAQISLATKISKENPHLLVTGGTDFHHEGHQGLCATCSSEKISDSFGIAELIKSREFILDLSGSIIIPNFF